MKSMASIMKFTKEESCLVFIGQLIQLITHALQKIKQRQDRVGEGERLFNPETPL